MSNLANRGPLMDAWITSTHRSYRRQVMLERAVSVATVVALAVVMPLAAWAIAGDAVRSLAAAMVASVGGV